MTAKQTNKLLTVAEAAKTARVTKPSLYYHIYKSRKLPISYSNGQLVIQEENLRKLYPSVPAGRKQKLGKTVYAMTNEQIADAFSKLGETVEKAESGSLTDKERVRLTNVLRGM